MSGDSGGVGVGRAGANKYAGELQGQYDERPGYILFHFSYFLFVVMRGTVICIGC
jgi:hypothetical protein